MNYPWQVTADGLSLSPEYIDVWCIRLDAPDNQVRTLSGLLSDGELARAEKYLSGQKAREFIITRAVLKMILGTLLDRDPRRLTIEHTPDGKPVLAAPDLSSPVQFSVSHSHKLALIAVTLDSSIGIDIEILRADIDHKNLSRRFFTAKEHQMLEQIDEESRLPAFFATWTRKEAIVKATGTGIAASLKAFEVSVDPFNPPQLLSFPDRPDLESTCSLMTVMTGTEYVSTLAVLDSASIKPQVRHWVLSPDSYTDLILY